MHVAGTLRTLAFYALLSAAEASAEVPRLAIAWESPRSCPRPPSLERDVAERVASDLERSEETSIAVRVSASGSDGYELTVSIDASGQPRSTRSIPLASCDEVQRAAAILIATAIVPASSAVEPADTAQERRRERAFATRSWSMRATALGDYRSLPEPRAGFGFGAQYATQHIPVWAEARYLMRAGSEPRSTEAQREPFSVELELVAGALGSAYWWRRGALRFGPQAEIEVGGMRARTRVQNQLGAARWGAAASLWLGVSLDYEIRARVGVYAGALAGWVLWPPRFTAEGALAYELPDFSARAVLGVRVLLGPKKTFGSGQ